MCTILFSFKTHPNYDFIFMGNRDEFKTRPSANAGFWKSNPNILSGIDLDKGGSWTGITREGRIAFVTNYRRFPFDDNSNLSRGFLTSEFLKGSTPPEKYLKDIQNKNYMYSPFNLIIGTPEELWYYSNIENKIKAISPGIYGISNSLLDIPWYKVEKAKKAFSALINTPFSIEDLFDILDDREVPADKFLPKTGVPLETERLLSSIHIDGSDYGTLYKTIILISKSGKVDFHEKHLNREKDWVLNSHSFELVRK